VRNHLEELLVGIDARTTKFVRHRLCRGRLYTARYGLSDIFYVGGLQPCQASPKHRVSWKSLQELHKGIEESVVLPEHDRGANDDRICKDCLRCQFTFASIAYVKRAGRGIGSDPRNMDEALNTRPVRLACEPFGRFHMHGVKCLSSTFDIEADSIHHAVSPRDGSRY
jgi:hypothetical protein